MSRPFDDIRALIASMPGLDVDALAQARGRPAGLGRLKEIAEFMAAWQGGAPHCDNPLVAVFAGNHGVAPQTSAQAGVDRLQAGGGAINQICKTFDLSLKVYELALSQPTGDITREPAMDERTCAATIAFGMEPLAGGPDVLALGEIGGGETSATAIYCALFGWAPEDEIVSRALETHAARLDDPLEVLRRLGGREIAAMVGAILAARHQRVPVLLDGYVVYAAAAVLHALNPATLDHCLAAEHADARVLRELNKAPLLGLGVRLGEGAGAGLAMGVVKAAVACHKGMEG